jgi:hypothetical protein
LTGKPPLILKAIAFEPCETQKDLRTVNITGNPDYRIDPYTDDFYRRVIDLRATAKGRLKNAVASERAALDSEQLSLKILANAASYGNFVEINVEDLARRQMRTLYDHGGQPREISTDKSEQPGRYFHPLIAALITGAARLMLAITERLTLDNGLDWTFCDTDSMAIACPAEMLEADFARRVQVIRSWFEPLNPYAEKGSILKQEDANYRVASGKRTNDIEPLYATRFRPSDTPYLALMLTAKLSSERHPAMALATYCRPTSKRTRPLLFPRQRCHLWTLASSAGNTISGNKLYVRLSTATRIKWTSATIRRWRCLPQAAMRRPLQSFSAGSRRTIKIGPTPNR